MWYLILALGALAVLYGMRADAHRSARRVRWDRVAHKLGLQTSSSGGKLLMTGQRAGAQLEIEEELVLRAKEHWFRTTVRLNLASLNAPDARYRQAMMVAEPSLFDNTEVAGEWLCGSVESRTRPKSIARLVDELRERAIAQRL